MKRILIGIGILMVALLAFIVFAPAAKENVGLAMARELLAGIGLAAQEEITVEIVNMTFPPAIQVRQGAKVTWVNRDATRHNVIADDWSFKTELIGRGESVSVTFPKKGEFPYYCGPHPFMRGTVEVN